MKHLFVLFFLISSGFASAQFVLSTPQLFIFYRGYDNKVEATSLTREKNIQLSGPDFEFRKESETKFIGRAIGEPGPSKIYMTNSKNGDTIDVFKVEIRNLPDPNLYFGGAEDGGTASIQETRFFAKYGPEIPLNVSFMIIQGTLTLQTGQQLKFTGNRLGNTESELLQQLGTESTVFGEFTVKGPDGNTRTVHASWNL